VRLAHSSARDILMLREVLRGKLLCSETTTVVLE
jgi:hypothetical protein